MGSPYWKTRSSSPRRENVVWPSAILILRQVGILVLISALWSTLLIVYLHLTSGQFPPPMAAPPKSSAARVTHASTPTPRPTDTATPTKSPIPSLPSNPTPTVGATLPPPKSTDTSTPLPSPTQAPTSTNTPASTKVTAISFSKDVLPILQRRCVKCHGGEKTEQSLILKTYADVMAGSSNGPVITPGNVADSFLVEQITNGKMPKNGPRLLPAEIQTIRTWVEVGAPNN